MNLVTKMQFTRVVWIDYTGLVRTKVVPTKNLRKNVRVTRSSMVLSITGSLTPGSTGTPVGEVLMLSPKNAYESIERLPFRHLRLPWHPSHFFTFADMHDQDGNAWKFCPRRILRKAIGLLEERQLCARAGFELEFALMKNKQGSDGCDFVGGQGTIVYASFQSLDIVSNVLDDMVSTLSEMGIEVCMMHGENGIGQFEIVLDHYDIMTAVENVIIGREVVRAIARKHGFKATFVPIYGGLAGNGGHVHLSLEGHFGTDDIMEKAIDNEDFKIGVDVVGQQFMAGILNSLDWLMFPCNSSVLSYRRIMPGAWSSAFAIWGFNNKEAAVRLVQDRSNFEIKIGDGISNSFLAMAAIITAGVIGIDEKLSLPPPCQIDPMKADDPNDYKRLPQTVESAMKSFADKAGKHATVAKVFPKEVVQDWVAARKAEVAFMNDKGEEEYERIMKMIF